MLQRGYIILILGAALLISGILVSALWAGFLAVPILHENAIVSGILIRPAKSVNASTQVTDVSEAVSLAIRVEVKTYCYFSIYNNCPSPGGQIIPNNILRETVRNPNGVIMTANEFTKEFFTIFKPDIAGKYILTVNNLGNSPVRIAVLVGSLPFIGAINHVNINPLSGIFIGFILVIVGIVVLIAGITVLMLDRRRNRPTAKTAT